MKVFVVEKEAGSKHAGLSSHIAPLGRDSETKRILDAWEDTKEGKGHLSLIVGQAGIGKTLLSNTIRGRINEMGYKVYRVSCSNRKTQLPFEPFIELVRTLFVKAADSQDSQVAQATSDNDYLNNFHPRHCEVCSYLLSQHSKLDHGQRNSEKQSYPKKGDVIDWFERLLQAISSRHPIDRHLQRESPKRVEASKRCSMDSA